MFTKMQEENVALPLWKDQLIYQAEYTSVSPWLSSSWETLLFTFDAFE